MSSPFPGGRSRLGFVSCLLLFSGSPVPAQVGVIGINVIGGDDNADVDASSLAPMEVAGVVPQANWNNIAPLSNNFARGNGQEPDEEGSLADLLDSAGQVTTADVAWAAENTFASLAAVSDQIQTSEQRLLDGYLDSSLDQPTVQLDLTEIPYASYDLLVYFGSDGDSRTGSIRVDDGTAVDEKFYITATSARATTTGATVFRGPSDYTEATATVPQDAEPSQFARFEGLTGSTLKVEAIRGSSNSGIHGLQIVQRVAPLQLVINERTGEVTLTGRDTIVVDVNGLEFTSAAGSLRPDRYESLGDQQIDLVDGPTDADDRPGTSPGEQWETVFAQSNAVIDGFLYGSTSVNTDVELSLGRLYDTAFGRDETLGFRYSLTTGQTVEGEIVFDTGLPAPAGDFNADGIVDAADYTVWRDNLGAAVEIPLNGAGDGENGVDQGDYGLWAEAVRRGSAVSVPEPGVGCLAMVASLVAAAWGQGNRSW